MKNVLISIQCSAAFKDQIETLPMSHLISGVALEKNYLRNLLSHFVKEEMETRRGRG